MNQLKPTQVFAESQFQASQPAPTEASLKPSQHFESSNFAVPSTTELDTPTAAKDHQLWWWGSGLGCLFGVAALQWWQFLQESWQQGMLAGSLVTMLTVLGLGLASKVGLREWRLWRQLKKRQQWHFDGQRLQQSMQFGEAYPLCLKIQQSLPAQVHSPHNWQEFESQTKPEFTDAELLVLFNNTVLSKVDLAVELQIRQSALQTGAAVAVSPFALADMLLVVWRGSLMLREISMLYGAPIGKLRSLAMIKQFVKTVFFTGASEIAIDIGSDLLGAELSTRLSARFGQGVLAAVLMARLGRFAQQHFRPLPLETPEKSFIKQVGADLLQRLMPGSAAK